MREPKSELLDEIIKAKLIEWTNNPQQQVMCKTYNEAKSNSKN